MMLQTRPYNRTGVFSDVFREPFFADFFPKREMPLMKTDIKEEKDNYLIEIDLPGYDKSDIRADLKDGYLTVSVQKKEEKEEKDEKTNYIHRERFAGSCKRRYFVGSRLTQEDIKASFTEGVLRLTVPKEENLKLEEKNNMITIE